MRILWLFTFLFAGAMLSNAQTNESIPYGNNPAAGKYVNVGDARLYYESYGSGDPFVLLHGGVYGYIDEFQPFIDELAKRYHVICIATRGHGKSEIGTAPYSWQQRAEDAFNVIRSITKDSVQLLGFSDGGYTAFKLSALHPEVVKRVIVIGAGDRPKDANREKAVYTPELLLGQAKEFFEDRLKIMPEPKRWGESLTRLNTLYNTDVISRETFEKIKCPVLVMGGDRDGYLDVSHFVAAQKAIAKSQLSIIPGCDHVVFFCNFPAVWQAIVPFLK
jgi:pimeloyl-ACP methyl ester carboxylesterase